MALGAALCVAFTARLLGGGPEAVRPGDPVLIVRPATPVPVRPFPEMLVPPGNATKLEIIEIMVGPEGSHSGWTPQDAARRTVR
jgi:hypothetical protein